MRILKMKGTEINKLQTPKKSIEQLKIKNCFTNRKKKKQTNRYGWQQTGREEASDQDSATVLTEAAD